MPALLLSILSPGLILCLTLVLPARAVAYQLAATPTELAARPKLQRIEADVRFLESKLRNKRAILAGLAAETAKLARERLAVEAEQAELAGRARSMMPALWDMNVGLKAVEDNAALPWDEADRNIEWTAAAFAWARQEMDRLAMLDRQLAGTIAREAAIGPETLAEAKATEAIRDRLLAERLKLLDELTAARREHPSPGERLERILELVAQADLSPLTGLDEPIQSAKGKLSPPVDGARAWDFGPEATPPHPGVGFATAKGAPVRAVHWGRVAFAGEVKGLGKVVVVAHGAGYASVYARLGRVDVEPGSEVSPGGVIGACGTIGPGEKPGMSFELRFGLKPINPSRWLPAGHAAAGCSRLC